MSLLCKTPFKKSVPKTDTSKLRSRDWIVVINNYPKKFISKFTQISPSSVYWIAAQEIGAGGTPHIQAYIYYTFARSFSAVQKDFPKSHIEVAKGTPLQNRQYCMKGEISKEDWLKHGADHPDYGRNAQFEEYGQLPSQGARRDLQGLVEMACAGAPQIELLRAQPVNYMRYHRHLKHCANICRPVPQNLEKPENYWFWGPSHCGKSYTAATRWPDAYRKSPLDKWWPDYQDQEVVIIEEMKPNSALCSSYMKLLADIYPFPAEVDKGANAIRIRPKIIVVTSNYNIPEIWANYQDWIAIERRFEIIKMETVYVHPE